MELATEGASLEPVWTHTMLAKRMRPLEQFCSVSRILSYRRLVHNGDSLEGSEYA
jgi:hypothetical protein